MPRGKKSKQNQAKTEPHTADHEADEAEEEEQTVIIKTSAEEASANQNVSSNNSEDGSVKGRKRDHQPALQGGAEVVNAENAPPHAHPLSKIPSHTEEGDIYCCDECMGTTPLMWHCVTCGYDVCLTCGSSECLADQSLSLDFAAAGKYGETGETGEASEDRFIEDEAEGDELLGEGDGEDEEDPHKELEDLHARLGGTEGDKKQSPFGSWETPITSEWIVKDVVGFKSLRVDHENVYWTESRSQEKGRCVVVKSHFLAAAKNPREDITPPPFSARSRVHEYGGGEFTVQNGQVLFVNMDDQKLYSQTGSQPPVLVADARVADMDGIWESYIYAVYEDHSKKPQPENSIVRIDIRNGELTVVASGHSFYASPRVNSSGTKLAFIAWDHPNMPWDTSALYLCDLQSEGFPCEKIQGQKDESVMEPRWSKNSSGSNNNNNESKKGGKKNHNSNKSNDDVLYFLSDRTNFWNLYKYQENHGASIILQKDVEFGSPAWMFGASSYCVLDGVEDTLAVTFYEKTRKLCLLHTKSGELHPLTIPRDITTIEALTSFSTPSGVKLAFISGSSSRYDSIEVYDLKTAISNSIHKASPIDMNHMKDFCASPLYLNFPTTFNRTAHGVFYQPTNKNFWGLPNTLPPLLVKIHGGPTSNTTIKFRPDLQYWTSRGWAVLDVDYGGSAGYGREYRNRLNGQWGIVDLDDCCHGAQYLVNQGLVDENRLAITGGSAGGYTVLACLAFRKTFSAGASHFGVSDLAALASDTHKFESRYLDTLVGPYPERKDIYTERSPIFHVENFSRPLVLFQGLDDKVVPPNQSRLMYEAVKNKGLPVALVEFEGEGHGFRQADNIRRALDGENYFYSRVFGFPPSPDITTTPRPPIVIENLDTPAANLTPVAILAPVVPIVPVAVLAPVVPVESVAIIEPVVSVAVEPVAVLAPVSDLIPITVLKPVTVLAPATVQVPVVSVSSTPRGEIQTFSAPPPPAFVELKSETPRSENVESKLPQSQTASSIPSNSSSLYPLLDSPAAQPLRPTTLQPSTSVSKQVVILAPAKPVRSVSTAVWAALLVAAIGVVGFALFKKRK